MLRFKVIGCDLDIFLNVTSDAEVYIANSSAIVFSLGVRVRSVI